MGYKIDRYEFERLEGSRCKITLYESPTGLTSIFEDPRVRIFKGSCTVWYQQIGERLHRCHTNDEWELSGIWETERHKDN